MFYFEWLLSCALSVDDKIFYFKGIPVDKMIISYKNEGGGFQADDLSNLGYTYTFLLMNEGVPKEYTPMGL